MKNKKAYRIGLYIRVSTEEQAENPEGSIRNQEERLRQTVKLKNMEGNFGEIVEVFLDRARSGKDTKRPALQRMLTAIRNREINLVMSTELSRVSRSIKDFADIWEMMQECECGFQSLRENFDTTTAAGEMVLYTMANIAQFERRQVSERVSANFQARAARGLYNGGSVPFGFRLIPEKPGYLDIHPEEAEHVRQVFKAYIEIKSLHRTAKFLNEKGIKLCRKMQGGGTIRLGHFIHDTVHKILQNKAYIGVRVYQAKGETREAQAVWPAIVDPKVFQRAQELLKKGPRKSRPFTDVRYPYTLTGLLFCAECGDRMSGKSAHGRNRKIAYYDHAWNTKRQAALVDKVNNCEHQRILAHLAEPVVWREVRRFITSADLAKEMLVEAQEFKSTQKKGSEKDRLKNKCLGVASQLEALVERLSLLPVSVSPTPIFKQMEKLEGIKKDLEQKLQQIKNEGEQTDSPVPLDDLNSFRKHLTVLLRDEDNPETKAKIIEKVVDRIDVTPEGLKIQFHIGNGHFSRELAFTASSRSLIPKTDIKKAISDPLPKYLLGRGSNSLKIGGGAGNRTPVRKRSTNRRYILSRCLSLTAALTTTKLQRSLPQIF